MPGALQNLQAAAKSSQAGWVYGAFRLVDNQGVIIAEIYPEEEGNCFLQMIYWEWIPIQASLIAAKEFFFSGGFDTKEPFSSVFQDTDLSRQIIRYAEMARTDEVICSIRVGDDESTTNYVNMFDANRISREKALALPGAFRRILDSANDPYWHGRIVYCYLASSMWNMRQGRLFTTISRLLYTWLAVMMAGHRLFFRNFWRGAIRPHHNRVRKAIEAVSFNIISRPIQP